jgi:hypothetical protein
MSTRLFSSKLDSPAVSRTVDKEAPIGMRLELVDAVFQLLERGEDLPTEDKMYRVMVHSMGLGSAPGNPYNGFRDGTVRQLKSCRGNECTT